MGTTPTRTCVVWCPDWPVVVAGRDDPSLEGRALIVRERVGPRDVVRSASASARARGIAVGMRRREAEALGGDLVVLDADVGREAAAFEAVAAALERFTPRLEIHRPGLCAFPTLGPSRYFGGDEALAEQIRTMQEGLDLRVGIADGELAARLAARGACAPTWTRVVAEAGSAEFLAPLAVRMLALAGAPDDLVGLLERLGLTTLGAFAALPEASVLARFDTEVLRLHHLARGLDDRPRDLVSPPPDLVEVVELDPPATRVDEAAFAAKSLADRLLARLADLGFGCTRVVVEAETEHGETLARTWRHEGALTPASLAERVRWQLDAWLRSDQVVRMRAAEGDVRERQDVAAHVESFDATTGALAVLRLVPDEIVPAAGRQLGFWGADEAAADRADRTLSRVQGMLGRHAVVTAVEQGGRTAGERVRWVPWGEPRDPTRPIGPGAGPVVVETPAWPGAVPGPAPGRVFDPPIAAQLITADGSAVLVNGRGEASGEPVELRCAALPGGGGRVAAAAGPWTHDVRWWDLTARRRAARWQLIVEPRGRPGSELACLVSVSRGRAAIEAVHD